MNNSVLSSPIYALRGNLREARYWRLRGDQRKADWHMKLAAADRAAVIRAALPAAPVQTESGK